MQAPLFYLFNNQYFDYVTKTEKIIGRQGELSLEPEGTRRKPVPINAVQRANFITEQIIPILQRGFIHLQFISPTKDIRRMAIEMLQIEAQVLREHSATFNGIKIGRDGRPDEAAQKLIASMPNPSYSRVCFLYSEELRAAERERVERLLEIQREKVEQLQRISFSVSSSNPLLIGTPPKNYKHTSGILR